MSPTAPHQALYRRWRAQTFDGIVGQEAVVTTLRNAVRSGQVAHALLFVGPRGTGKTSMARIVAKALNCTDLQDGQPCDRCEACVSIREGRALDVVEMDAASNNRVDDMRDLLARTMTAPSDLRRKVYIVDEVQRITQGWDVLLRTLEEPPEHVAFIFCTTDASQIRPAVLSRVQRFDFRRLTPGEIEGKLRRILEADGRDAEPEAVSLVARLAAGGMRDAESMLDQLLAAGAARLTAGQVRDLLGLAEEEAIDRFVGALATGDALSGIALLDGLEERGRDLRSFLDQVVERIRADLTAVLSGRGSSTDPDAAELAAAGRRLASIDPSAAGPGGLRFQLELALLSPTTAPAAFAPPAPVVAAPEPAPIRASPVEPPPSRETNKRSASEGTTPSPASSAAETSPTAVTRSTTTAHAEATAPSPPSTSAGTASSPALEELRARWPEIVAHISQHPPTKPLIAACRPIAVEGNVVTLGFPEGQAFLRDVAERRRTILEEGVGRFLGRPVAVRCVATNLDLESPLPDDETGERLLAEARRIFADDLLDVGEVG